MRQRVVFSLDPRNDLTRIASLAFRKMANPEEQEPQVTLDPRMHQHPSLLRTANQHPKPSILNNSEWSGDGRVWLGSCLYRCRLARSASPKFL